MRTLKLTEQQFSLIQQALGITIKKFAHLHTDIVNDTLTGDFEGKAEQTEHAKYYWQKVCDFIDLQDKIKNGELDV